MPRHFEAQVPVDGRQSETAAMVARGVRRLLRNRGFSTVTELPLLSGRRADIVAIAHDGMVQIVEIKSSVADFRVDTKWPEYRSHCDQFFFAAPASVPVSIFPEDAGLIVADAYGATILRDPAVHKMPGSTRRAVLLAFGRSAADRLHLLGDPAWEVGT